MSICTYLSDGDYTQPTSDGELNSLLAEVRDKTGEDWRISERTFWTHRWFRRSKQVKLYTLYLGIGSIEFQIINFYRPDREDEPMGSINTSNDACHVAAFLYGLLSGLKTASH